MSQSGVSPDVLLGGSLTRLVDGLVNFHPSFLPPMFCAACEDSGQELHGEPCLNCGGDSYSKRLKYEAERKASGA